MVRVARPRSGTYTLASNINTVAVPNTSTVPTTCLVALLASKVEVPVGCLKGLRVARIATGVVDPTRVYRNWEVYTAVCVATKKNSGVAPYVHMDTLRIGLSAVGTNTCPTRPPVLDIRATKNTRYPTLVDKSCRRTPTNVRPYGGPNPTK